MAEKTRKMALPRIIAIIAVGLLPLLCVLMGVRLLCIGEIVTFPYVITFLILPITVFVGCFFTIRSKLHIAAKSIICILLLVVFVCAALFMMAFGYYVHITSYTADEAVAVYQENEKPVLGDPDVSELGQYEQIAYYKFESVEFAIFDVYSDTLVCRYDADEYRTRKEVLEERYVFQEEPLIAYGYTCEPETDIDGYHFRVLSFDAVQYAGLCYPKKMKLIATNDETCEIVYLSYYDDDVDYLVSLEEFLLETYGWKYIK